MTACLGIDVGIVNLSYCILARTDAEYEIKDWKLINVLRLCNLEDTSCKSLTSVDIHNIARFVIGRIFTADFIRENAIAHVSIEQQPGGKYGNAKIILFSHLIYEYFQNFLWNVQWKSTLQTVRFIGASQKYKKTWLSRYNIQTSREYKQRKHNSVYLCNSLCRDLRVKNHNENSIITHEKNDDLADAFLLALAAWEHWA